MTAHFPDIAEWYTPERIDAEEPLWRDSRSYLVAVEAILDAARAYSLSRVIEVGCGTGWIPTALAASLSYVGVDANPHMLARAREKNPSREFLRCDIRDLRRSGLSADLVCSFSVLKHFSLGEWAARLGDILSLAPFAIVTQHVLPAGDPRAPMDLGDQFHHIWPSDAELLAAVAAAGHQIISRDDSHLDVGVGAPESRILTGRVRE